MTFCKVLKQRLLQSGRPTFLVDFSCYTAPESQRHTIEEQLGLLYTLGFPQHTIDNHERLVRSKDAGLGPSSILPPVWSAKVHESSDSTKAASIVNHEAAMNEMEAVAYSVVEDALHKSRLQPSQVDILITACSCLTPIPSMSAMIANRFKMRADLRNYSLGGHGCAAGVIGIELAQALLKADPNQIALLVVHENITMGFCFSEDPTTHTSNVLFRSGGAAVVLSNRRAERRRAKYALRHTVRSLMCDDASFGAIARREDAAGHLGVFLEGKPVVRAAVRALRNTFQRLAPLVLPLGELVAAMKDPKYKPNWNRAFEHILIHTGAGLVIKSVSEALGLLPGAAAPSSETLTRFWNLSCSSTFYILGNIETKGRMRKGDRVLQLGFGSGFKSAAAVWVALRDVHDEHPAWRFTLKDTLCDATTTVLDGKASSGSVLPPAKGAVLDPSPALQSHKGGDLESSP